VSWYSPFLKSYAEMSALPLELFIGKGKFTPSARFPQPIYPGKAVSLEDHGEISCIDFAPPLGYCIEVVSDHES
jgi:hypothetical protein